MKKSLLLTSIFFLAIGFCFAQTTLDKTFQHGGLTREYKLHIPGTYDGSSAVPLVFNLHGRTSTSQQQMVYTNFNAISDTANFIICYPQGTIDPVSSTTYWNIGIPGSTVNDVDFIVKLIDEIAASYNINQQRVYVCGMSNGGYLSYKLACESNRFAAMASVTGSMVVPSSCSTQPPIPVMQIHGTADPVVNYNGYAGSEAIEDLVAFWVNKNQCNTTPIVTNIPDIASDGTTTEHYLYTGGINNHTVEFYKVIGGEHTWPGATVNIGVTSHDFSASKEIWRFFSTYTNQEVSLHEQVKIAFAIFPNPAKEFIALKSDELLPNATVRIFDLSGKMHLQTFETKQIAVKDLSPGVYIVKIQSGNHIGVQKLVKM